MHTAVSRRIGDRNPHQFAAGIFTPGRCALVLLVLVLWGGCHRATEQDRIKQVVVDVQKAAEEKNIRKIIGCLSKTYSDPQGLTYDTVKGYLLGYFFRHQTIHVYITNLEATVENNTGSAAFQAVLTGGDGEGAVSDILPGSLSLYSFDVSFKKEDDVWKITSARWNRVGDEPR